MIPNALTFVNSKVLTEKCVTYLSFIGCLSTCNLLRPPKLALLDMSGLCPEGLGGCLF